MKALPILAAALFSVSANATPVTFDLTASQFTGFSTFNGTDSNYYVTSGSGTTAEVLTYTSGGNLLGSGTRDQFGMGTAQVQTDQIGPVAVFSCSTVSDRCSTLDFLFNSDVRLLSVVVSMLNPPGGEYPALYIGSNTNATHNDYLTDLGWSGGPGSGNLPTFYTIDFSNSNRAPEHKISFEPHPIGNISIRSFTVDDPSVDAVPEPATALLLVGGLAGLGAVRRSKQGRMGRVTTA